MPELGERKQGRKIGKGHALYEWAPCTNCGKLGWRELQHGSLRYLKCAACSNNKPKEGYISKRHPEELKLKVLSYYGHGKCACVICGESRIDCLSIDHIENNGYLERKAIHRYGNIFYLDLQEKDFPDGYQTLCMNCQFIKAAGNRDHKRWRKLFQG